MSIPWSKLAILVANLLLPVALVVFSSGFFPYKPLLPGMEALEESNRPPPVFEKIVFMVVDALRSDFIYSNNSGFTFTQSLIRSGSAVPFTAHARSPTVTLPRIKAIMTGSVPSFSDIILNIAESDSESTLIHQDSLLAQFKTNLKGELIMYGDDTWLRLFPGMFSRADGTTSFFVSDFVEVDNNVTRHIADELQNDDWAVMTLHYLGLDHIGHKSGPKSPHMIPKQHEMDSIVREIYTSIEHQQHLHSTLLVLCGDHGMNDVGNHGGSSAGETSPALVFITPKFQAKDFRQECPVADRGDYQYYRTVEQSDITPTLAGLLGVPIPRNSLGVFIPELLSMWDLGSERLLTLQNNSKQMFKIIKAAFPGYAFEPGISSDRCESVGLPDIEALACAWFDYLHLLNTSISSPHRRPELESVLLKFLRTAQRVMSSVASNYDVTRLYLGLFIASIAVFISVPATHRLTLPSTYPWAFLTASVTAYGCMMFASSYVEEEQQYWFWIMTGWTFYLFVKGANYDLTRTSAAGTNAIVLAALYRVERRWNQTGQKFAAEPDIAHSFIPQHLIILWAFVCLSYIDTCRRIIKSSPFYRVTSFVLWSFMSAIITTVAFTFKLAFTTADSPELVHNFWMLGSLGDFLNNYSHVLHARLVFLGTATIVLIGIYALTSIAATDKQAIRNVLHESLTLCLMTQSRTTNIPLFIIFRAQNSILAAMSLNGVETSITSILSQYMAFFCFGGSNSISSVDLSAAYNGVGSYNVLLVGALTFLGNWAGPIWWVSATNLLLSDLDSEGKECHIALSTFHSAVSLFSVMTACTVLRTHLFIWTVFSPKFLYSIAWVANHFFVNILTQGLSWLV